MAASPWHEERELAAQRAQATSSHAKWAHHLRPQPVSLLSPSIQAMQPPTLAQTEPANVTLAPQVASPSAEYMHRMQVPFAGSALSARQAATSYAGEPTSHLA